MRLRKNLLIALLCALIAALGLFCFVGCDGCSPDNGGNQGVVTPNPDDGKDPEPDNPGTDVGEEQ